MAVPGPGSAPRSQPVRIGPERSIQRGTDPGAAPIAPVGPQRFGGAYPELGHCQAIVQVVGDGRLQQEFANLRRGYGLLVVAGEYFSGALQVVTQIRGNA